MSRRIFLEEPPILPQPPDPPPAPEGFVILPLGSLPGQTAEQWALQNWLYQQAYEKALAVCRPSLLERDILGQWN